MVTESTGRIHVVLPQEMRSRRDDDEGKRETYRTSTRTAVDGDDGCRKLQCRPINNNSSVRRPLGRRHTINARAANQATVGDAFISAFLLLYGRVVNVFLVALVG